MFVTQCPHCRDELYLLETELNCGIYRHAVEKNGNSVDPHCSKERMDVLIKNNVIFGCGQPFRIVMEVKNGVNCMNAISCDWK